MGGLDVGKKLNHLNFPAFNQFLTILNLKVAVDFYLINVKKWMSIILINTQ